MGGKRVKELSCSAVSTKTRHLGFVLDSTEMSVAITPERRTKTADRARQLTEMGQWSCRQVQQMTGSIMSCSPVLQGRAFRRTRRLNAFLSEHLPQANTKADYDELHEASAGGTAELQCWTHIPEENPKRFLGEVTQTVHVASCDASNTGHGGAPLGSTGPAVVSVGVLTKGEQEDSSTAREMRGIIGTLQAHGTRINNSHTVVLADNQAQLQQLSEQLEAWGDKHNATCRAVWMRRCHDEEADLLSRCASWFDKEDFTMNNEAYRRVLRLAHCQPTHDAFASELNHELGIPPQESA